MGVAVESSHEEIKRAFTERALRYRPDRQPDPNAAEQAAFRRSEINEAWATLRNPAARAAYDATLKRDAETKVAALTGGLAGTADGYERAARTFRPGAGDRFDGTSWFSEPEVADVEPLDEATDEPATQARRQRWHLGPLAIGGVVLIAVLVLLLRTNNYDDRPNTVQTRERFAPGVCVLVVPGENGEARPTEVPCSAPRTGKVRLKVEFPRQCPMQTVNVVIAAEQMSLCLDP
ncbi:MAG: J domain-containing protein [Actinobacteria bacterium]|nr:J domain-containing protein [Actinomycetota bacterium]